MKNFLNCWYHPEKCNEVSLGGRRNYYMDNLKFFLIILVVMGHFSMKMTYVQKIEYIHHFIYIFHMPCFIFVSGFFAKRMNQGGKLRVDKVLSVFWLYLVFQFGYVVLNIIFDEHEKIKLLEGTSAPWYLLALFVWYLCVPVIERIKNVYLIPGSFVIGILAGYITSLDDVFTLSRVFVFFPFFIVGFCLSQDRLERFLNLHIRIVALLFIIVVIYWMIANWDQLTPYFKIVYGYGPYKKTLGDKAQYGYLIRSCWYLLSFALSVSFMLLVPRTNLFFTSLGQRTLQVYMTHIWFRNALGFAGFFLALKKYPHYVTGFVLLACIPLTFLLSNKLFTKLFGLLTANKLFVKILKKDK